MATVCLSLDLLQTPFFSDVQIQLLEAKEEDQKPKPKPRDQWSKEIEFLLASIGYCVGVGNIWR